MKITLQDEDRFFGKVLKLPGWNNCWLWMASTYWDGYGKFYLHGKEYRAHRISWDIAFVEPLRTDQICCHKCDTPKCVNPKHLFIGTQKDNIQDCVNKNRKFVPRGSRHTLAKLTEEDVVQIKKLLDQDLLHKEIAELFGVSRSLISHINNGDKWAHV